jgi:hypothetical protein
MGVCACILSIRIYMYIYIYRAVQKKVHFFFPMHPPHTYLNRNVVMVRLAHGLPPTSAPALPPDPTPLVQTHLISHLSAKAYFEIAPWRADNAGTRTQPCPAEPHLNNRAVNLLQTCPIRVSPTQRRKKCVGWDTNLMGGQVWHPLRLRSAVHR